MGLPREGIVSAEPQDHVDRSSIAATSTINSTLYRKSILIRMGSSASTDVSDASHVRTPGYMEESKFFLIGKGFALHTFEYSLATYDAGCVYFQRMSESQRAQVATLIASSLDAPWDEDAALPAPSLAIRLRMCVLMLCVNIAAKFATEMPFRNMIKTLLRVLTRHSTVGTGSQIFTIEFAILEALEWRLWYTEDVQKPAAIRDQSTDKALDLDKVIEVLAVC